MNDSISSGLSPSPTRLRQAWKALIRPGAHAMSQLRLSGKLALLVVAMSVPLYALIWQGVSAAVADHEALHVAAPTVQLLGRLTQGQAALQRLRARTTHMLTTNDAPAQAAVNEQRRAVQVAVQAIQEQWAANPELPGAQAWPQFMRQAKSLADGQHARQAEVAFEQFNALLVPLQTWSDQLLREGHVANAAGSAGQPLAELLGGSAKRLSTTVAELQASGSKALAGSTHTEGDTSQARFRVLGLAWAMERDLAELGAEMSQLNRHSVPVPGAWTNVREIADILVLDAQRRFGVQSSHDSATSFVDISDMVLDQTYAVHHDILSRLATEIEIRTTAMHRSQLLLLAGCMAASLFLAYLIAAFYISFHSALRQVHLGMQATEAGDLSFKLVIRGRDELADIARSFDHMNDRLSSSTADIRSRAARVDLCGRQVAEGSQQLAQRTDEQAISVRSTAGAIEQISSAVSLNAQAAREVDALSERLFAQAEEGNAAMAETVVAMDELQTSSARVNEMVAVIDDVAFHTGMLALNASIEAARAGVSGKGFAVVAGEVRQLALRCAEAADEIRSLISASSTQVQASSNKLQHVSAALDTLVNGVREVSGQLRVIASASTQQSAALAEVESNIHSLQTITVDNAALVETSQTSANALLAQAATLAASVASMRLRHGSADEARALVERAAQHARAAGRTQAIADFNRTGSEWTDRDLFVFSFDRLGNIAANSRHSDRVGENVNSLEGLRGSHHAEKMWEMADSGGGWVRYELVNPSTGCMTPKESYVLALDEDLLIGCGCYGRPKDAPPAGSMPKAAVAWSRASENQVLAPA